MEKWSQARINAWKRYIEQDREDIKDHERSLIIQKRSVESLESLIASRKASMEKTIQELEQQQKLWGESE